MILVFELAQNLSISSTRVKQLLKEKNLEFFRQGNEKTGRILLPPRYG